VLLKCLNCIFSKILPISVYIYSCNMYSVGLRKSLNLGILRS